MSKRLEEIRKLALSIARCNEIADACSNENHPCHKIVTSQERDFLEYRQVPEAWAGNLDTARILYVSSNPSISTPESVGTGEDYPLAGYVDPNVEHSEWPVERLIDFQVNRLEQQRQTPLVSEKAQFLCVDGAYRGSDKLKGTNTSQKYWMAAFTQARELLGESFDLSSDICMTEVVHCKSKREIGVQEAAALCSEKYLTEVLKRSGATLVVVVGAKARQRVMENYHQWNTQGEMTWQIDEQFGSFNRGVFDPRDQVGLLTVGGRDRIVIATQQLSYGSNRYRYVKSVLGEEPTRCLRRLLERGSGHSFASRGDLLSYLGI